MFDHTTYLFLKRRRYANCIYYSFKVDASYTETDASLDIFEFCIKHLDKNISNKISLFTEETVKFFLKNKKDRNAKSVQEIFLIIREKKIYLYYIDNGQIFNPKKQKTSKDTGILIINNLFQNYSYSNTLS